MIFGNRNSRQMPQLNTASLPDLIFTVLFFFMVVTHMRTVTLKVSCRVPQGTELTRLTKKTAVSYIYIGRPTAAPGLGKAASARSQAASEGANTGFQMQINDRIATPSDIAGFMSAERRRMSDEDRARQTVSVKADQQTPMGMITDVKQALRRAHVERINYSAEQRK